MTDEDRTAARLKGYNCLIKFKDGEEIYIEVDQLSDDNSDNGEWFVNVERFINAPFDADNYFPLQNFAIAASTIKYVRKI